MDAHSQDSTVFYTAKSTLVGAQIDASGQTKLTGDYDTQAKLTIAGLDIGKPIELFGSSSMKATSSIGGVVTISWPAEDSDCIER